MKRFVIVVDAQRDFMLRDGALYVPGAEALVGTMNAWLATLRPADTAGVLLTFDTHEPERYAGSAEAAQFPPHCLRDSAGWQTVIDTGVVDPAIPLHRLEKDVFAMWEEPGVTIRDARDPDSAGVPRERFFATLREADVEEVVVIGVAADFCVRWAIDGLVARGFRVVVPARLTRGIVRQIDAIAAEAWTGAQVAIV